MPLLTRVFIKTAMVYLSLALLLGVLMVIRLPAKYEQVYVNRKYSGWQANYH